jgi:16S rRNA (cytidine1402-2'-O)-methyltransferase
MDNSSQRGRAEPATGVLYIVSTPIGNLDDITLRALNILKRVDLIAAEDTRTTRFLLSRHGIENECISFNSVNQFARIPSILDRLRGGASVAVVSDAGTPGISDPAAVLVSAAVDAGIEAIAVPGASALLAALVVSGLHTERFVFEGFLPIKKRRQTRLRELASEERTIVLYESVHRIERTLRDLLEALGDRRVTIARELTKIHEECIRGTLVTVLEGIGSITMKGEFVIVIEGLKNSKS